MKILVLENSVQTAYLIGCYNQSPKIEDVIFKYSLQGKNATEWGLNFRQVSVILAGSDVKVTSKSKYSSTGMFTIGCYKNWLYNHNLHQNASIFEDEIIKLLQFSLYGIS
ncbi:hypothetical protein [Marinomonas sp. FW-1]|uniref:hypothetical protein n=1 Tax=Marinomonas sp. FW-1 TaxID=2071621 RepID=UPI0010C0CA4C|nr:hypothetical protein [Marinomonas sp. FW-1]